MTNQYDGKTTIDRFWEKISVGLDDECWEWQAYTNPDGYGRFWPYEYKDTGIFAHQYSWILHNGFIPKGLEVCHSCDNRKCVNPRHLFVGTHHENILDMVKKGRSYDRKGIKNPKAKLNEEKVSLIKKLRREGLQYKEIAKKMDVSVGCVSHILNRRHWAWVV